MCCCASRQWIRHSCDLINCALVLYWIHLRESAWRYFVGCKWVNFNYFDVLIVDCFGLVVFAIDWVAWRTVSQLFTCVSVTSVSVWYKETVNVIRPEWLIRLTGHKHPRTNQNQMHVNDPPLWIKGGIRGWWTKGRDSPSTSLALSLLCSVQSNSVQ